MAERPLSHEATWYNDDASFQEAVNETLRLKREVLNVPTLETKKLEGNAVAQLCASYHPTALSPRHLTSHIRYVRHARHVRYARLAGSVRPRRRSRRCSNSPRASSSSSTN